MLLLVTGATGYIGGRLVPELLAAGHRVRCLARTPAKLDDAPWRDDVEVVEGDLSDPASVAGAMEGVDGCYFLVHSMGGEDDFAARDREVAATFRDAAAAAGVQRIVYLGGLGADDDPTLSPHLASRHEVGRVLADGPVPVTELRAAVIIGSGSASFEMLRSLVEVLPVMVTPKWVGNRCQPTAISDVLTYLVRVVDSPAAAGRVLEVGGPDVVTYAEMMRTYARAAGLRPRVLVPIPVLTPALSSLWIGLVTPIPSGLARPLVESLVNEVVVRDRPISEVVDHEPLGFERAVELAVARVDDLDVARGEADRERTTADSLPSDPGWAGGRMLSVAHEVGSDSPPDAVFAAIEELDGARPGRREPWPVDTVDRPHLLRRRAALRLPGEAWLEWRLEPTDGGGTRVRQRLLFHPRGLLGRVYWYSLLPVHRAALAGQARRLVS